MAGLQEIVAEVLNRWDVDWSSDDPRHLIDVLVGALAARGIDLELAYQWGRVQRVMPEDCNFSSVRCYLALSESQRWYAYANSRDDLLHVAGIGPTPAIALAALADKLGVMG